MQVFADSGEPLWRRPAELPSVFGLILAAGAIGCTKPVSPCVEGVEPGDTLEVNIIEPYDENAAAAYDLDSFFTYSDVERLLVGCDRDRDQIVGLALTVDVIGSSGGEDGIGCSIANMAVRDVPTVELGSANNGGTVSVGGAVLGGALIPIRS